MHGEVNLKEFSVAWKGADPGSKQVKKLHEEFGNEPIDRGVIHALAEINGFDLNQFCLQLGFDNHQSVKSFSFPTNPQPEPKGESKMANDADIQQLQKQIKDLSDERDTLKTENAELETQLETSCPILMMKSAYFVNRLPNLSKRLKPKTPKWHASRRLHSKAKRLCVSRKIPLKGLCLPSWD